MPFNAKLEYLGKQTSFGWLVAHKSWDGTDCLVWPFSRNGEGYGMVAVGNPVQDIRKANRVMCELANGEAPSDAHVAAHSCGNGHGGCVHPKHLSWKTQAENEADKKLHGNAGGGRGNRTKITAAQVAEMRASKGIITAAELGKRFGLTRAGVRYWQDSKHDPVPPGMSPASLRRRGENQDSR